MVSVEREANKVLLAIVDETCSYLNSKNDGFFTIEEKCECNCELELQKQER